VLAVVGELGYVLRGGSDLLGSRSERARMRRSGRLISAPDLDTRVGELTCPG